MTPNGNKGRTVLVVEDDVMDARLIENALKTNFGPFDKLIVARDVSSALKALERKPVDLVLLDLNLLGRSGMELLEYLRANGNTVPVFVISGLDNQSDVDKAYSLGANGFIPKTASHDTLVAAVRQLWIFLLFTSNPSLDMTPPERKKA